MPALPDHVKGEVQAVACDEKNQMVNMGMPGLARALAPHIAAELGIEYPPQKQKANEGASRVAASPNDRMEKGGKTR